MPVSSALLAGLGRLPRFRKTEQASNVAPSARGTNQDFITFFLALS